MPKIVKPQEKIVRRLFNNEDKIERARDYIREQREELDRIMEELDESALLERYGDQIPREIRDRAYKRAMGSVVEFSESDQAQNGFHRSFRLTGKTPEGDFKLICERFELDVDFKRDADSYWTHYTVLVTGWAVREFLEFAKRYKIKIVAAGQ